MRTFYLSTPIYYVNSRPHIGHLYTTVVADTVARYRRMAGDRVFLLTGTDEHGQNIQRAAAALGLSPIEHCDRIVEEYRRLWTRFGIAFDDFVRTTEPRHARGVAEIIRRLDAAGDLYLAKHEGWYCASCEAFYTEKELLPGRRCPTHETPTEWTAEENVYFRLSKYQDRLLAWIDAHPEFIRPETRRNEVRSFVEQGLRDLSVSRANLEWGIPFPGRPGQTVYVWLDALTNYISALGFGQETHERYETFWENADERLHLVGKDILRFHAVYWPAFLMSAGLPLPTTVYAHGWWLRDEKKMSKSTGNVVRPDHLVDAFGPDPLRYFLLREMVFGQDANFSDEAFVDRYNADFANDLGNTVSRVVTLSRTAFDGKTPPIACDDNPLIAVAREVAREYREAMDELAFQRALQALWRLLAETNQYLVARAPWKQIQTEGASESLSRVLWNGLEATRIVATGLLPVMPETAAKVLRAVGTATPSPDFAALAWGGTPTSAPLAAPEPLFPRIDKKAFLVQEAGVTGSDKEAVRLEAKDKNKDREAQVGKEDKDLARGAGGGRDGGARSAEAAAGSAGRAAARAGAPAVSLPGASFSSSSTRSGGVNVDPENREKGLEPAGPAQIEIGQFAAVELKIGNVVSAEMVPKSERLLKVMVDIGEASPRQLVAGIAKAYRPEDLVGRQVVVVANLKPAKLMGVESQGMLLAATNPEGLPVILTPSGPGVAAGTRVK